MKKLCELLTTRLGTKNVLFNELMSKHTTFKIGGECDIFVTPTNTSQVEEVVKLCKSTNTPYYVIGRGSNLLVGDKGFRGVIICICKNMNSIEHIDYIDNDIVEISAGAGIMLSKLSNEVWSLSCKGFEFASGIPGTLGGAVTMNAGAYGGEINDCIVSAKVLTKTGQIKELTKDELALGYRSSIIQKEKMIVLSAKFAFNIGDKVQIREKMDDFNNRRKEKQPLEYPSAGSTFKRPEGYYAGKLIMDAGLAGYSIGDACVSEKHCGFVINKGNATAKDTLELIKNVDKIVFEKYGVHLEPEVRIIGEF